MLQPGRAGRAATLISRSGIARRSSQVNWTMIVSARGWHGLVGLPATLGTGIPWAGGVRTMPTHQAISAPGKAVAEDRQIACLPLVLLPVLLPGRTVSALLPMAGTRRTGLSCGTSGPGAGIRGRVLACVARGQRPFFYHRNMPLTCGNVKLREFEPWLSCCHARGQRSSLVSKYDSDLLKC